MAIIKPDIVSAGRVDEIIEEVRTVIILQACMVPALSNAIVHITLKLVVTFENE